MKTSRNIDTKIHRFRRVREAKRHRRADVLAHREPSMRPSETIGGVGLKVNR